MAWVKSTTTLGDGMQVIAGRVRQTKPQLVETWKHDCEKCGCSTVVMVTDPKQPVRAFCCGKYVMPPVERQPQPGLLTRLLG